MLACAFTSNRSSLLVLAASLFVMALPLTARADPSAPLPNGPSGSTRTDTPEEDDFSQTPFTQYGDFSSSEDEAEDSKFFQFGRFFGVSVGAGYAGATGNRGLLYDGGFPSFDIKVLYWFDFHTAMSLGITTASFTLNGQLTGDTTVTRHDVNYFRLGVDFRYYFDTQNATGAISFSNPFLTVGFGNYSRNLSDPADPTVPDKEDSLGFSFGGGMEFAIKPKKTYFNLEGKFHVVNYSDTNVPVGIGSAGNDLPDQAGWLFTVVGSLLFTW